ncbi:MAG: phenylalanine--tRNA ligase subunit beta [Candidatus Magasanikbacteria bacterium]|nr:phenylalanine--tRNA ligase subunit beta [Candidatus Magasanikbacteria bacterium]
MIISLNWLRQFVKLPSDIDPADIAERLVMHTAEIDRWWRQDEFLDNVVVGRVLSVKAHPNADKLKLCTVTDGKEKYQVVCGGSNVRDGMKCAFARIGARVKWHGAEAMTLAPVEIRGKKSFGMICAAEELGLALGGEAEREIMDLGVSDAEPGTPLAKALQADDAFFEVDNKAINHRPDLWGHIGFAREVAALYEKPFAVPEPASLSAGQPWSLKVRVEVAKLCPRYQAVVVENVRVTPSPEWMQRRLRACGIRPINNVVDVTNWVMMELGQPMHAFDVARLKTKKDAASIIVRPAKRGEKMLALDGVTYALTPEMLVIADEKRALAVAGVIGGEASAVTGKTETILFESANFNPASVRATAKALGTRTESSARFEKSLDPTLTGLALARAVELLRTISPDVSVASPVADAGVWKTPAGTIDLSVEKVQQVLGAAISAQKMRATLEQLGFHVRASGKKLRISVPTWRATRDVTLPEDLIEEIGRVYGYEKVDPVLPKMNVAPPPIDPVRALSRKVRDILVRELGYSEVLRYSFVNERAALLLGETGKRIEIENPIDDRYLRATLVPNIVVRVEQELHTRDAVRIFEVGKVFNADAAGPHADARTNHHVPGQDTWVTAVIVKKGEAQPFGEARRLVEALARESNNEWHLKKTALSHAWAHPGRTAVAVVDGTNVGWMTELHPGRARAFGISERVGMVGLNVTALAEIIKPRVRYAALPSHPTVERDVAFVIDRAVTYETIVSAIEKESARAVKVELFDVFEGKTIPAGKKSMAFHVTYAQAGYTMTTEEVEHEQKGVIGAIKKLGGSVR